MPSLRLLAAAPLTLTLAMGVCCTCLWRRELSKRRAAERKVSELRAVLRLAEVNNRKRTLESLRAEMAFCARATDVVIATFPKCGTTLLQQLVHQLRTGGSWDFAEISDVVPWLESCLDFGVDPQREQGSSPRAFKSHMSWPMLPRGARVITVLRKPSQVLESFYNFYGGYKFDKAEIGIDAFARNFFAHRGMMRLHGGTYYEHLLSFWEKRDQPNLLILCYEDVVADPTAAAAQVAAFIGVPPEASRLAMAVANSSRDAMLLHGDKFDDASGRRAFNELCGQAAETGVGVTTKVNPAATFFLI